MTFKTISYSFFLAGILTIGMLVPVAHAEETTASGATIAIIDLTRVIKESSAGKDLENQVTAKEAELKKQADSYEKELQTKKDSLISDLKTLDQKKEDDRKKSETKRQAFEAEIMKKRQDVVKKKNDIEKAKFNALKEIQTNVAKVAADIADERKIQIVLDRQAVLIAIQGIDITDEALKRLNTKMKSVSLK